MPLYRGGQRIAKLYCGAVPIAHAYRGASKVFDAAPATVLTVITPVAVNTSFTHAAGGAAQANMYDGNDATPFADPAGANTSTRAAYQFSTAREIRRLRFLTHSSFGFTHAITFNIAYSDTSLTAGFTNLDTLVIPAGTAQEVVKDVAAHGAHLYWRIHYASGTTGGNVWGGELSMYAYL